MKPSLLLASVLALVTGLVVVSVVPAPSASAATSCTRGFSVGGGTVPAKQGTQPFGLAWFDVQVPESLVVLDLDYTIDIDALEPGQLGVQVFGPQSVNQDPRSWAWGVQSGVSGPIDGSYTFDDEAPAVMTGASPAPGRYRPAIAPAADLEGQPAAGRWRLAIANGSDTSTATVRGFTVTLTLAECDRDGDGFAQDADNCPDTANADQADLDGDRLGDACDADLDGDAVLNTSDRCPAVLGTGSHGCPRATRTVTLDRLRSRGKLSVRVRSTDSLCRSDTVTLMRKRKGRDKVVRSMTTSTKGVRRVKAPRGAGRYYVQLSLSFPAAQAECPAVRSRAVRVRARDS